MERNATSGSSLPGSAGAPQPGDSDRGYVDWGAILAGAAIAAGTSIVLTTFAAALGLGAISPDPDGNMISGWGLALTALFTAISMVAIYMLGGYIAGRLRKRVDASSRDEVTARDGIHGLVVWALGMILTGWIAASAIGTGAQAVGSAAGTAVNAAGSAIGGIAQGAGQLAGGVVSGAGQLAGGAVSGLGQAAGGAAAGAAADGTLADALPEGLASNPLDYLTDGLLRQDAPGAGYSEAALRREVSGILMSLIRTGEISERDRQYLVQAAAARTGLSEAEVNARVDAAVTQAQEIRAEAERTLENARQQAETLRQEAETTAQQAAQAAIDAAEKARQAAILSAFLLAASSLIAGAAAYIGAVRGGRHRDESKLWGGLRYHR